jgi:hypothetical protein
MEGKMNKSFGEELWDIYANHKGEWCLYKSQLCQEGICNNCQIFWDAEQKWHDLIDEFNVKLN